MVKEKKLFSIRTYPQKAIKQMKKSGYNPIIIGDTHEIEYLDQEKKVLLEVKDKISKDIITVALEILPPIQLEHIVNFLEFEKEYYDNHSKRSKGYKERVNSFEDYRRRLSKNYAENLALWLLENGFHPFPIEHEDALDWSKEIDNDVGLQEMIELDYGWREVPKILRFYKDIPRDIHILKLINEKRPDIICIGCTHTVKYDYIMGRDGGRSIYIPESTREDLTKYAEAIKIAHDYYQLKK